jgi:hypothetical protein
MVLLSGWISELGCGGRRRGALVPLLLSRSTGNPGIRHCVTCLLQTYVSVQIIYIVRIPDAVRRMAYSNPCGTKSRAKRPHRKSETFFFDHHYRRKHNVMHAYTRISVSVCVCVVYTISRFSRWARRRQDDVHNV